MLNNIYASRISSVIIIIPCHLANNPEMYLLPILVSGGLNPFL